MSRKSFFLCGHSFVKAPIGLPSTIERGCHGEVTFFQHRVDEKGPSGSWGPPVLPDERLDLVRPVSAHHKANVRKGDSVPTRRPIRPRRSRYFGSDPILALSFVSIRSTIQAGSASPAIAPILSSFGLVRSPVGSALNASRIFPD
jgi:hypothetical protein